MPNTTTKETFERREKLKVIWAGGCRNLSKISDQLGCAKDTVKRDLVILRKDAHNKLKRQRNVDLIRVEEDFGILQDIEQINKLIQDILANQERRTEVVIKDDKPSEKKQETYGVNYKAIIGLVGKKLQARMQRAELWGLVNSKMGVNVSVSAQAGETKISTPHAVIFSSVKDECQISRL